MIELEDGIEIAASAEVVFAALTNLRAYDRWLDSSKPFRGITEISDGPVGLGTSYVESEPNGVRRGTVTTFEPPTVIGFHQEMAMKPRLLGTIVMDLTYTVTQTDGSTRVDRVLHLTLPAQLQAVRLVVLRAFRREARRIMLSLKAGVESAT